MGLSALLGGASLIKGMFDQDAATRAANSALGAQNQLTARQVQLFQEQLDAARKAISQMDYGKALAERKNILQREAQTNLANLGAASRIAGYRPSDTPTVNAMSQATGQYLQNLADTEQQMKQQYATMPLQLLGQVNANLLNPSIQAAQQQYQQQYANAQNQNPFAGLIGLSPYIFKPQK